MDIIHARILNQLLGSKKCKTAGGVVAWLGAVQAQDFISAKWGIGLRMKTATDAGLEEAFNKGAILRTHIMRPTWHFVMPDDIRWMQELTSPRVRMLLSPYDRKLSIDRKLISKTNSIFEKVLRKNNFLTRDGLAEILNKAGIKASGQKLGHLVMHAELDAVICSGPRLGKQFSYALLEERAPNAVTLNRDEALAALARTYFQSHGPAQVKDFAWWSGLTVRDAQRGTNSIARTLVSFVRHERTFWMMDEGLTKKIAVWSSPLLSIYDEYTIAYTDRSDICEEQYRPLLSGLGNALTAVLVFDGMICGTWKRTTSKKQIDMTVHPFRRLTKKEKEKIEFAATQYGIFYSLPVKLKIT